MTVKPGLAANWFTSWRKGRQSIDTTVNQG